MRNILPIVLITTILAFSTRESAASGAGSLDYGFGIGGRVESPNYRADSIAIQPDGKFVTVGCDPLRSSITVARFNPDGSLDPGFGQGGLIGIDHYGYDCGIAVSGTGKIIVSAWDASGRTQPPITAYFIRLNSNGSLDSTFGNNGTATPAFSPYPISSFRRVAVQPDGKVLAAGYVRDGAPNFHYYSALIRLNDNGSVDTGFSANGVAITNTDLNNFGSAIAIQTDGKIISAGYAFGSSRTFTVRRFNVDGSPDSAFNSGNAAVASFPDFARVDDVLIQPDGKILLAGETYRDFALARFSSTGSLDNSFDGDGKVTTSFGGFDHRAGGVVLQPDGKIVAGGGHSEYDEETLDTRFYGIDLARYNTDGSLDTSFGNNGKVSNSLGTSFYANDILIQSDGKLIAAGFHGSIHLLARYNLREGGPFDFDGDNKTDISIFRPAAGEWWINRSSNGSTFAAQFGASTDVITPGDFTGDGRADIAVWRPSSGEWLVLRSEDFSYFGFPFGTNGDDPVPADYDADGQTDSTVFRPSTSTWYIRRSSDGGTTIQPFGATGDIAVPSDYDGDGKADIAIFRPSVGQWWINRSTAGVVVMTFGNSSDKLVPGDYTGDGKSDTAIWRPSTGEWFVVRSEDFSYYSVPFGTSNDIPAPGDYDGDGKFDATVFRPSSATWYSQRTTAGTLFQQFGTTGDRPVPNAFVP